jgi:FAD/FMN-containing dehydrogenase
MPSFGHAGDGNIHVNIMVDPDDAGHDGAGASRRAALFEGTVALEGSISGEHGIGFSKRPYVGLELSPDVEIALMQRIKAAFDPHNPATRARCGPPPAAGPER